MGPVCLPEPVQEELARLILARIPASILSTKICNEDRDGSPLVVMGGDGRYTQIGVGCTEPGDSWFYIKYSALKNWINPTLAHSLTLFVVRGGDHHVQQGGVGPGLVHLAVGGVLMCGNSDGGPTL